MADKSLAELLFPTRDNLFEWDPAIYNFAPADYSDEKVQQAAAGETTIAAASVDRQGLCHWLALDLDNHTGDPDKARINEARAFAFLDRSPFDALLEKSNQRGGYHLWMFLPAPLESDIAANFIQGFRGCDYTIEVRPYRAAPLGTIPVELSNTLRFPGKHRIYRTMSEVWDGGEWRLLKETKYG